MSQDIDDENKVNDDSPKKSGKETEYKPEPCRMYEQEYPEIGDILVARVKLMADMGAYCSLLEYNDLEGMLLYSELQRKRIRSIKSVIKVGRQEIVQVLRVNHEKGYIDLSRKRVTPEDVPAVEQRWNNSKSAHSIMLQVSRMSKGKYTTIQLYEKFGWPMARKFKHLFHAFKWAMNDWDQCFETFPEIPEDCRKELQKNIENRLKPQLVTVRAQVEVTCFTSEGVDAIKKALKSGLELSTDEYPISIKLVAPPRFTVSLNTFEKQEGIKLIKKSIDCIHTTIKTFGGTCNTVSEAQVIAMEM